MTRPIATALLAVIVAGWAPVQQHATASAALPAELAYLVCLQHPRLAEARCRKFHLPDPALATADALCVGSYQADIKTCGELRVASPGDPPAHSAPAATVETQTPRPNGQGLAQRRIRQLDATAQALYKATSRDAETFTAALLLPDVRRKIEAVLRQKLSDEQCRVLARKAQAEALYWYRYMQGLERVEAGDAR
jgi:hypothetical protein